MRGWTAPALALALFAAGGAARADDLTVQSREYGSWPQSVAALQGSVQAEGQELHVFVLDEQGNRLTCGSYTLALDAVAGGAFEQGPCDLASRATSLRLVHRAALFAHDDVVPRPLSAAITATQVRVATVRGGAAPEPGGSDVVCSVAIRPFLRDLEHGTQVFLRPGRFVLRPGATEVTAQVNEAGGWILHGTGVAGLTVDYEVVDTLRNAVVVHDRATLNCGSFSVGEVAEASAPPPPPVAPAPPPAPTVDAIATLTEPTAPLVTTVGRVTTRCEDAPALRAGDVAGASTLGGSQAPLYRVRANRRMTLQLELASDFGGQINVYTGCPRRGRAIATSNVFGGGVGQRISWELPAGDYFLSVVDADVHPHVGQFNFSVDLQPDYLSSIASNL